MLERLDGCVRGRQKPRTTAGRTKNKVMANSGPENKSEQMQVMSRTESDQQGTNTVLAGFLPCMAPLTDLSAAY